GTLHTNSASKTVDRLIDVFPETEQEMARTILAGCLKGIVSQQLLRTADGKARVGAVEVAFGTFAVSNLIREGKTFQLSSTIQAGKPDGMQAPGQALCRAGHCKEGHSRGGLGGRRQQGLLRVPGGEHRR